MYKSKYLKKIEDKKLPYKPNKETKGLEDPMEIVLEPKTFTKQSKYEDYCSSTGAVHAAFTGMSLRSR